MLHFLLLFALSGPVFAARPPPTVQAQYEQGLRAMNRGAYVKSLEILNQIRIYHRDDPLSVKAELAIADVYFKKGDWDQARQSYEEFAKMHPRYPDVDYVVYRTGLCLTKKAPKPPGRDQTYTVQAVSVWQGFTRRFPSSTYAPEVAKFLGEASERLARRELQIGRFYERRAAWRAVRGRTLGLVQMYPDSATIPEAVALLGHALPELAPEDAAATRAALEAVIAELQSPGPKNNPIAAAQLRAEVDRLPVVAYKP